MDTTVNSNPAPNPVPNPNLIIPPPRQQPVISATPTPTAPSNNKFKYLIMMTVTIILLLVLLIVLYVLKIASSPNYTPPLRPDNSVNDFGFLYIISTRITLLEAQENNTFKIGTTIKDKQLSTLLTSNMTRVVAMDKEKEREVPRKILKKDMNVDLSLYYSLRVNQWRINKVRITSVPYNVLLNEIIASSSAANTP